MKSAIQSTVLVLALAIGISACQRRSQPKPASSQADAAEVAAAPEPIPANPARFPMPEAMMQHMRNLEQELRRFEASAEKDHAALASAIDLHTTQLISSCTMQGPAHDALHQWLMPFLELNKDYAAASDEAARSLKLREIQDSLAVFHERFE